MSPPTPGPPDKHHLRTQTSMPVMFYALGSNPRTLINATFALATIGQFALLFLIATLTLSHTVRKRSVVLLNLLAICLLGSISHLFLMYAAEVYSPKPPTGLCVIQAALVEGVDFMFAVVSLSLVIDVLVEAQVMFPKAANSRYLRKALVTVPYTAFLTLVSGIAAFGVAHPEQVGHMPNDLACTLNNPPLTTAVQIAIAAIVVITLSLETYAIIYTIATRRHLPTWRRPQLLSFSQATRVLGFTCLQALLLIFGALRMNVPTDSVRIATVILQAMMPITTFCIFGLTADCCHAWKGLVQDAIARSKRPLGRKPPVALPRAVVVNVNITVHKEHSAGLDSDLEFGASKSEVESDGKCAPEKPIRIPLGAHVLPW
ncbi:hypothetical protein BC628DRAFT_1355757 [Trametes gibbosa]|nr:hypothetical protein BC628DRAFT_1355757 [Trametes gibbosa]